MFFVTLFQKFLSQHRFALLLWILLFVAAYPSNAQNIIQGVVKDAAGEALVGVSVLVKGSAGNGTITNINGNYSIRADARDVLLFSYVGMKSQEIRVGNRRTVDVIMEDIERCCGSWIRYSQETIAHRSRICH